MIQKRNNWTPVNLTKGNIEVYECCLVGLTGHRTVKDLVMGLQGLWCFPLLMHIAGLGKQFAIACVF